MIVVYPEGSREAASLFGDTGENADLYISKLWSTLVNSLCF